MICPVCGTESHGAFCPKCGTKLQNDAFGPQQYPNAVSKVKESLVPAPSDKKAEKKGKKNKRMKEEEKGKGMRSAPAPKRQRKKITFGMVFEPALALLLPAFYFAADLFVIFSKNLHAVDAVTGKSLLLILLDRLSSPAFEGNSFTDLVNVTYGTGTSLFETLSFSDLLKSFGNGTFIEDITFFLPLLVIAVFSAFSVLMGVLILFTGGRILSHRTAADMAMFAGSMGGFSPLLANLILRLTLLITEGSFAAADTAMRYICFSAESMFLMGLAVCATLPAVSIIRRAATYANDLPYPYINAPYRKFSKRAFGLVRTFSFLLMLPVIAAVGSFLFYNVLPDGSLLRFSGSFKEIIDAFLAETKSLLSLFLGSNLTGIPTAQSPIILLCFLLQLPLLLLTLLPIVASLLQLLRARVRTLCDHKTQCKSLLRMEKRLERPLLLTFISYTVTQVLLVFVVLFGSRVVLHLDFSSVPDTLGVFYTVVIYIKGICGTTTLYALIAFGGMLFARLSGKLAHSLVLLSSRIED